MVNVICNHPDICFFALPAVIPGVLMLGCDRLDQPSSNGCVRGCAWFGKHIFALLTAVAGIPLLIYSLLKTFLLKGIHSATDRRHSNINRWVQKSEMEFNKITTMYSALLAALSPV